MSDHRDLSGPAIGRLRAHDLAVWSDSRRGGSEVVVALTITEAHALADLLDRDAEAARLFDSKRKLDLGHRDFTAFAPRVESA